MIGTAYQDNPQRRPVADLLRHLGCIQAVEVTQGLARLRDVAGIIVV